MLHVSSVCVTCVCVRIIFYYEEGESSKDNNGWPWQPYMRKCARKTLAINKTGKYIGTTRGSTTATPLCL